MSEENKQNPQEEPVEEEKIPQQDAPEQEAPEQEPAAEKAGKSKKKKEKMFSFTREQVEQMELAAKKLDSASEQYARLAAEYDNYRKRTAKEKEKIYQDAQIDTLKEFLAVYDNLERAVATEGDDDSPHKKGLEMIFAQFKDIMKKLGVTEIQALGQPFDPEKHNAVMHIDDDNYGENTVAQVFQAGFMLGDKVLRFSVVQVAN